MAPCQKKIIKNVILMCAMGSCIKVVKQKIWFPTEKKMLSPVYIQKQNRKFSVMGIRKIINSLPLTPRTFEQYHYPRYPQKSDIMI
jgi:hypothetical protein